MSRRKRPQPQRTLAAIFGAPMILAALSLVGVISALVGDGPWDAASWAGLGIPAAVMAWFSFARQRPR